MTTYLILRGILSYVYEIQFATHHDKSSDLFCFDLDQKVDVGYHKKLKQVHRKSTLRNSKGVATSQAQLANQIITLACCRV